MIDGRPQNNGMVAYFNDDGHSQYVTSTTKQQDVSGWSNYLGQIGNDAVRKGFGRSHTINGNIFIGDHQGKYLNKGKLFELQPNGTFTLF